MLAEALFVVLSAASPWAEEEGPVLRWMPVAEGTEAPLVGARLGDEVYAAQQESATGAWVRLPADVDVASLRPMFGRPAHALAPRAVQFDVHDDRVDVRFGEEPFTSYHLDDGARPYFHPVRATGGIPVTRSWPMADGEGEAHDHPHHRSLWFSFGDVQGVDCWSEKPGRIVPVELGEPIAGSVFGEFDCRNEWRGPDGAVLCTDQRRYRFFPLGPRRVVDVLVSLRAGAQAVDIGDTKEGMMALRVAPSLRVDGEVAQGSILNSAGHRDGDTWGKRAHWCDFYGPVGGTRLGIAMYDHPANLRHPTWWHVRSYGLFAANPFGISYFEGEPRGTGDHRIPAGGSLDFRYRIVLHPGDPEAAGVAEDYRRWTEDESAAGRAPSGEGD